MLYVTEISKFLVSYIIINQIFNHAILSPVVYTQSLFYSDAFIYEDLSEDS